MERRRAFTMMELGIALVTLGLFGIAAYPRFERSVDRASVRTAKQQVIAYLTQARSAAIVHGRDAMFVQSNGEITISIADSTGSQVMLAPPRDLFENHHIRLTIAGDTVRFDDHGYARSDGGRAVIRLAGRVVVDSLCIPRSGRISERCMAY